MKIIIRAYKNQCIFLYIIDYKFFLSPTAYLSCLFGQVKGDSLADFRRQLTENISFESANHNLTQSAVQLLQVGRSTTIPLPTTPKIPAKQSNMLI